MSKVSSKHVTEAQHKAWNKKRTFEVTMGIIYLLLLGGLILCLGVLSDNMDDHIEEQDKGNIIFDVVMMVSVVVLALLCLAVFFYGCFVGVSIDDFDKQGISKDECDD